MARATGFDIEGFDLRFRALPFAFILRVLSAFLATLLLTLPRVRRAHRQPFGACDACI